MSERNYLAGKKVAILAADGFEQSELQVPKNALLAVGATVDIVSLQEGTIRGWRKGDWGDEVDVDKLVSEVAADDYNALVLPGGVMNPDTLRESNDALAFVKGFFGENEVKPVAAICHGAWMLAEADVLKDRTVTSYSSIKTDLINAGANWIDKSVVVDHGLVTSRVPGDLVEFSQKLVEEIAEGRHAA
ncbi:PfpI family intracellular protease [gamma proteobacterium BDW918]|uniref:Glutamine amidotransferase n=1 Tax=Zhongshania aliphaticivorans TaxID=1470434 RepID=A0A127M979_9GAMM|nr:type 1 glutamine amidotransferase domain-containing protein [Zhongshania aliphaticivorans]AMO69779.1 glutamine amidotransferase [Zhongshania aliphaticivorans]EIF41896.1 PfpI family intracellular protease [gamma proteobacterium BDW918]